MEASLESRAKQSQGGGAAGVHRQTLDGKQGSEKIPESPRDGGRGEKTGER